MNLLYYSQVHSSESISVTDIKVQVRNSGASPEGIFRDPRLFSVHKSRFRASWQSARCVTVKLLLASASENKTLKVHPLILHYSILP